MIQMKKASAGNRGQRSIDNAILPKSLKHEPVSTSEGPFRILRKLSRLRTEGRQFLRPNSGRAPARR